MGESPAVGRAVGGLFKNTGRHTPLTQPVSDEAVGDGGRSDLGRTLILGAELLTSPGALVVFFEVLPDQIGAEHVVRLPCGGQPRGIQIAIVHIRIVEAVVIKAVTLGHRGRSPHREGVAQRNIDHHLAPHGTMVAGLCLEHGVEVGPWQIGDHIDHAAGGVASIQRALRPPQHLDPVHIQVFLLEQAISDQRGVVEADSHGRIAAGRNRLGPDPADREVIHAEIGLGEADVGDGAHQFRAALDLQRVEGLGRKGRDRDRHVLDRFFALLGRDDDVSNRRGRAVRRGLSQGRRRHGQCKNGYSRGQARMNDRCRHLNPSPGSAPFPNGPQTFPRRQFRSTGRGGAGSG
ncbi:hypothetical protein D3C86_978290 [compost metagenome]